MNVKLDRYYKFFDEVADTLFPNERFKQIIDIASKIRGNEEITYDEMQTVDSMRYTIENLMEILNRIFKDIEDTKGIVSEKAYEGLIDEFKLRLNRSPKISIMSFMYFGDKKYEFFDLMNKKKIDKSKIKVQDPIF